MAKKSKEVKQWITIKGNHIPVYEGQTVDDAAKNFMKHEKKAKSSEAKEEKEKIFTVYQPSTILGDRVHTRLENISAKNEEEAIRKYKEIYPKAWDKHIAYTVNNEDGSSSEERWYKSSESEGASKQDKTKEVTKAIKEKASNNSYLSKLNQEQLDEVALDGDANERKQASEELKRRGSSLSEARDRRKKAYAEDDARIKAKKDANKQAVADIKAGLKEYGPKRGMWQDVKKADKEWDKVKKAFQNGEINRETYEKIYNMFGENFHRSYKVRHMKNR